MTKTLVLAAACGVVIGAIFFGGLWWTVSRGISSQRPALWFLGSLLARMSVALAGFYFVSGGHWERLLMCLLGFVTARLVVTRLTQINLQSPDDTATGTVPVVVQTASGSATSTVTLAQFAPSFLLLDAKHVTGIILRSNGSGAYGGGTYDIIGPTGSSLGYPTVAATAGDSVELYGVGFGPTSPVVLPGHSFSGAASTTDIVKVLINNMNVVPSFVGLSGAGLYQINLTLPAGLGTGDVPLVASISAAGVNGAQTQPTAVISLQ
jgi:uncharacterized protein (TIGR03437 family)